MTLNASFKLKNVLHGASKAMPDLRPLMPMELAHDVATPTTCTCDDKDCHCRLICVLQFALSSKPFQNLLGFGVVIIKDT